MIEAKSCHEPIKYQISDESNLYQKAKHLKDQIFPLT